MEKNGAIEDGVTPAGCCGRAIGCRGVLTEAEKARLRAGFDAQRATQVVAALAAADAGRSEYDGDLVKRASDVVAGRPKP